MKHLKLLFLYFLVGLILGCTSIKQNDPYDRYVPKSPNWKFAGIEDPDPSGSICYDCIYVNEFFDPRFGKYAVERFFESGHYMAKMTDDFNDINQMNTFNKASIGYFKVDEGKIIIEVFNSINFGQYGYSIGEILSNGDILIFSSGPSLRRQNKFPEPWLFRKVPVEGIEPLEPDW